MYPPFPYRLGKERTTMSAEECNALEKADSLARGAALKWASGVFCRPDQLALLGQYRRRETQRNNSIQSRLKSAIQSYLEGVDLGLSQLRAAHTEVHHIQKALGEAQEIWRASEGSLSHQETIQQLVMEHTQLSVVIQSLPHVYAVPKLIDQTKEFIEKQQLLEAHVNLRDLESLRDNVLYRLQKAGPLLSATEVGQQNGEALDLVRQFFARVQDLSEELGGAIFSLAHSALTVARCDPTILVSAVRIIEREEVLDVEESRGPPQLLWKPPGRPKRWRDKFFQALEKGVCERLVESNIESEEINPTDLAIHLKDIQCRMVEELLAASAVLVPCVPPHYDLCRNIGKMCHQIISHHLREILNHNLSHPALYRVLHWITIVYPSEDLMAHPELSPEIEISELGPLIPTEVMDEQMNRYTRSVRACLSQWIHNALDVEYSDWLRNQEPDKDQDGFYLSGVQQMVMQMLMENIQLASVLGEGLESRMRTAVLCEMENCLIWLRETLVKYGIEHMKERTFPPHYILYLLAIINACSALSSSIGQLQPEESHIRAFSKAAPCLQTSLDKTQKKACHLLLDELQTDIQPLFRNSPSRSWLSASDTVQIICEKMDNFGQHLSQVRSPLNQYLLAQVERMVTIEYVKALLHSKLACRNCAERLQLAQRMSMDAEELKSSLHRMSLEDSTLCVPLILALQELFALKDPSLLSLEISGLMSAYPDISDDHVLALLELRGDVSRDIRHTVLNTMRRQALSLPEDFRPIFISIPVPAPPPPFCLHPSSCA
ncbi:exocyst complex component 3-like protein isoform X2 [Rana temporaria]|uniref:exocyst complex component 3-like protein isoform X2 n=1 Tax=Rana temporaria TaxID=8407 RepID=UPI001AACC629|nr:exocyst complex component 3-like protein isoform X2 [Rana temporaria]